MPFDYNSFMQGVQTGLRLGRTTKSRVPPEPPVPYGIYILTEDGEMVLTEFAGTATVYNVGAWYSAYVTEYARYPYYSPTQIAILHETVGVVPYMNYIYWYDTEEQTDSLRLKQVLYVPKSKWSDSYLNMYWGNYLNEYGNPSSFWAAQVSRFDDCGAFKYDVITSIAIREILPYDVQYFTGTEEQLQAYIQSVLPMITEGVE